MALTVTNRDPVPGATNVSPHVHPRLTVATDGAAVDKSSLNVWVLVGTGRQIQVVVDGEPVAGTTVADDGLNGYTIVTDFGMEDLETVAMRVVAQGLDTSWSFATADTHGPYVASALPPAGAIAILSPTALSLRIADAGGDVQQQIVRLTTDVYIDPVNDPNLLQMQGTGFSGDGSATRDENYFDSAGAHAFVDDDVGKIVVVGDWQRKIVSRDDAVRVRLDSGFPIDLVTADWQLIEGDFNGCQGLLFKVTAGPDTGAIRRITTVRGRTFADHDGASVDATAVEIYDRRGLDVAVDGVMMIESGLVFAPVGWTAAVIAAGGELDVTITAPVGNWDAGDQVRVYLHAVDDADNVSEITYIFDVVDTRGPQVYAVTPAEGTRGLDRTPTPASDLVIDITCSQGVDTTSIDIEVNGAVAIVGGAGVGDWSTSTVVPMGTDARVTLKRATAYADGDVVFVDIQCADLDGRPGERRVLRYQFGATIDEQAVAHGLTDAVVRVIAFDLSQTPFANPETMAHTGFGWDGREYDAGSPTGRVASWYTELGAFPLAGSIVVTQSGWAIVEPLAASAWMHCHVLTPPTWSMAGSGELRDADFGPEPVLCLASDVLVEVDFTHDRARVYRTTGRTASSLDIAHRQDPQVGTVIEANYALPTGVYHHLAACAENGSLVMALSTHAHMTLITDLTEARLSELMARDGIGLVPPVVVTRALAEWATGTWVRMRLESTFLVMVYNDAGQGQFEVWDWFKFVCGGDRELFLDDGTTPALAAGVVADVALRWPVAAAAMATEVDIVQVLEEVVDGYDQADLGLGAGTLTAVALDPNFQRDLGNLYASDGAGVARFNVRDKVAVLMTTTPATSLSTIGETKHHVEVYVNTSMDVV